MSIIDIIEDTSITLEKVQVGDFIYDKTIEQLLLKIDKGTYATVRDSSDNKEARLYFDDEIDEDDTYTTDVKLTVILKDDIKYKKKNEV